MEQVRAGATVPQCGRCHAVHEALVPIPSTTKAKMWDLTREERRGKQLRPRDALAAKQENHSGLKLSLKWKVRKDWEVLQRAHHGASL